MLNIYYNIKRTMESIQYGQYNVPSSDVCACLNVGQPSNYMLPIKEFSQIMTSLASNDDPSMLQYGNIQGYEECRNSLSKFLSRQYTEMENSLTVVDPNNLFMTNGNTGGLQLLIEMFAEENMTVFTEDTTYFLALKIFRDARLNVVPVEEIQNEICIDSLEKKLANENGKKCLLYLIPFHHNPTGNCLSVNNKNKLVNLCNNYPNLTVISDEVYHLLNFTNIKTKMLPLAYYSEKFISLGSFSKIFYPAVRCGWIQSSNKIITKLNNISHLDSSGNLNPFGTIIVHNAINNGFLDSTLEKWKDFLESNCKMLYDSLMENLSDYIDQVKYPTGGYFLWVKFKSHIDMERLSEYMEHYKIKYHHGNKFSSSRTAKNYARLSFSWYPSKFDYDIFSRNLKLLIDENIKQNTKVYVNGYKGRLGSLIVNELKDDDNLSYIPIDWSSNDFDLSRICKHDVVVDVSSPAGTRRLLENLFLSGVMCPVIIGTTGQLPDDMIDTYGKFAPIAVVSNFSVGVNQMNSLISLINKDHWNASLIEKHHVHKKDKPSGTAKTLAETYGTDHISLDDIKSIREGETIGEHHLVLEKGDEKLIISHYANDRKIFAQGAICWIYQMMEKSPGVYKND